MVIGMSESSLSATKRGFGRPFLVFLEKNRHETFGRAAVEGREPRAAMLCVLDGIERGQVGGKRVVLCGRFSMRRVTLLSRD